MDRRVILYALHFAPSHLPPPSLEIGLRFATGLLPPEEASKGDLILLWL